MSGDRRFKVIVSGNIVEVYEFEMPLPRGKKKIPYDPETGEIIDEPPEQEEEIQEPLGRRTDSARRARMELRRLLLSNFDNHSKFITLTFAQNVQDVQKANAEFGKFIKRLKTAYGAFKYAVVVEFQERGAVHYHMVSELPYIPKKKLREIWGHGFVKINDITSVDNVGAYITAYMTKDLLDKRLNGKKAYFSSRNLTRPIVVRGWDAIEIIEAYMLDEKKEVFTNSYESEYLGQITYKEYNLKRDVKETRTSKK